MADNIYKITNDFLLNKDKILKKFNTKENLSEEDQSISGMDITVFLIYFVIIIIFYVFSIVEYVKNYKKLPKWAKILAFLTILGGSPILTLTIVYLAKDVEQLKKTKTTTGSIISR